MIALRLPKPLLKAIDDYAESERKRAGFGLRFTRSDAVRELVAEALRLKSAERSR